MIVALITLLNNTLHLPSELGDVTSDSKNEGLTRHDARIEFDMV